MKKILNNIFNGQAKTITSAAIIIGGTGVVSRLLGAFRDRVLAGSFGAGDELDIYWAAFRIPDLVFNLLVIGGLSAGFIPVFISHFHRESDENHKDAWQMASAVLNLLVLAIFAACLVLAIFAPWLMKVVTPGFSGEKLSLTIALTRIMFLSPIFMGASAVLGGILQSAKRFFIFSLAPIMYNLGIIFGALILTKIWGIYGLAVGVIFGAFLHMAIQIPSVLSCGFKYELIFNFRHEGVKRIVKLTFPRTLSLTINQIIWLGMTAIASMLGSGRLAVFNLANNLYSFPLGVFGLSFAAAAFPSLSEWAVKKDWQRFSESLSFALRQVLFFIVPASGLLIVLRAQIVRVILGSGKFDWEDTILTIQTLQYFILGLFAQAIVYLLIRAFFALEDTKTPFYIGLVAAALEILLALILVKYLGVSGLALAVSVGSFLWLVLLWIFLRRKVKFVDAKEIIWSAAKIVFAAFLASLGAYGMLYVLAPMVNMQTGLGVFLQGFLAGISGMAIYILFGILLRLPEAISFWNNLRHRLPFSRVAPQEDVIAQ